MHKNMVNPETALSLAHEVIRGVAEHKGHHSGSYDTAADTQECLAELLGSLRLWCYCHGTDWDRQLALGLGRAKEMEALLSGRAWICDAQPAVEDLRCPDCGHSGSFVIEMISRPIVLSDGGLLENEGDPQWDSGSYCRCPECECRGSVSQFLKVASELNQ